MSWPLFFLRPCGPWKALSGAKPLPDEGVFPVRGKKGLKRPFWADFGWIAGKQRPQDAF